MVFMPRIDLWAVETETPLKEEVKCDDDSVKENASSVRPETVEKMELQYSFRVSHAWNTFLEQVESLRVSTKMIILVCLTSYFLFFFFEQLLTSLIAFLLYIFG